jgi:tRNA nucleotidyltransferase (CCA-adding enzyme)
MSSYQIKKIISVEEELSLQECEKILISDSFCLGIYNGNRETIGFVKKADLINSLKYEIKHLPIKIIAIPAETIDKTADKLNDADFNELYQNTSNQGIFLGKSNKEVREVILFEPKDENTSEINLSSEYENKMPETAKKALALCSHCADKYSIPLYLVGGAVRDLILKNGIIDIDVAVEDNAIEFARLLRKENPAVCRILETHEDFKTAKVAFQIDDSWLNIDIASTRKEIYPTPAGLPVLQATGCPIAEDLSRRDFSINAMALYLNKDMFCKLIDPFKGYKDIKEKRIKILHNLSFIEDPTRIIRGLKFKVRFSFELNKTTENLQKACLESGLFNGLCGERVKSELKQTFNLNNPLCLEKFIKEKMFLLVDKDIFMPKSPRETAKNTYDVITQYGEKINKTEFIWLIYLGVLISEFSSDKVTDIAGKLYLSGLEAEILLGGRNILKHESEIAKTKTRFEAYEKLEGYFPESSLISLINSKNNEFKEKTKLFLKELQDIRIHTNGKMLIDAGLIPGPIFGEILREILKGKVNGEINTKEDEEKLIKRFVASRFNN